LIGSPINIQKACDLSEETERDPQSRELIEAMRDVPSGAFALAGATVALLLLAWLFMYFFVFLPRGTVG
jgi:hypothetical protein